MFRSDSDTEPLIVIVSPAPSSMSSSFGVISNKAEPDALSAKIVSTAAAGTD